MIHFRSDTIYPFAFTIMSFFVRPPDVLNAVQSQTCCRVPLKLSYVCTPRWYFPSCCLIGRQVSHRQVNHRQVSHRQVSHRQVNHRQVNHRQVSHRQVSHVLNTLCSIQFTTGSTITIVCSTLLETNYYIFTPGKTITRENDKPVTIWINDPLFEHHWTCHIQVKKIYGWGGSNPWPRD